jgi:hypothetical protein
MKIYVVAMEVLKKRDETQICEFQCPLHANVFFFESHPMYDQT